MSETAITPIQTITELFTANLPRLTKGQEVGKAMLEDLLQTTIASDEERQAFIDKMVKVRAVGDKVKELRLQVTRPLDELKDQLMSFERDLDDQNKAGMFLQAKKLITDYNAAKLKAARDKEQAAELQKQVTLYKNDVNAAVGRQLIEMLGGQKRNLIEGTSKFEAGLTLANFDECEKQLNNPKPKALDTAKYDSCFQLAFTSTILSEEQTKEFIAHLKTVYAYDLYSNQYQVLRAQIHNALRAKMPQIKASLIAAQTNAEEEKKRQADIQTQRDAAMKASEEEANKAVQEVANQKDLNTIEADFTKQGQLADVVTGPTKLEASFTNNDLWIRPFLAVVQEVAKNMTNIKNTKQEYIPPISWWLKKYEAIGKPLDGLTLKEVPKTILKEKKEEE